MDYAAEEAGRTSATFATRQERLRLGLIGVETAIDLKAAVPKLHKHVRRRLAWCIVNGTHYGTVGGKYPDPQAIAAKLATLDAHDDSTAVAMLRKELAGVKAMRIIATHMSGRRIRPPLSMRADRRLRGKACARCTRPIQLGQAVFHDRDWGTVWHSAEGCHD